MSWSDLLKIMIPVVVAVIGWLLNEYSKRQWERYKKKEDRYVALVESLKGFYSNTGQTDVKGKKEEFLKQLDLCWLYCPDKVIQKAYNFSGPCAYRSPKIRQGERTGPWRIRT